MKAASMMSVEHETRIEEVSYKTNNPAYAFKFHRVLIVLFTFTETHRKTQFVHFCNPSHAPLVLARSALEKKGSV